MFFLQTVNRVPFPPCSTRDPRVAQACLLKGNRNTQAPESWPPTSQNFRQPGTEQEAALEQLRSGQPASKARTYSISSRSHTESGKGMQELLGHTPWACAIFSTQSQASLVALKSQHSSANQCLSHPTSGGPLCPLTVPPPRSRWASPVWLSPVSPISSVSHDAWSDVPSPILRSHKVTLPPTPGTNISAQPRGCTTETPVRPAALG